MGLEEWLLLEKGDMLTCMMSMPMINETLPLEIVRTILRNNLHKDEWYIASQVCSMWRDMLAALHQECLTNGTVARPALPHRYCKNAYQSY